MTTCRGMGAVLRKGAVRRPSVTFADQLVRVLMIGAELMDNANNPGTQVPDSRRDDGVFSSHQKERSFALDDLQVRPIKARSQDPLSWVSPRAASQGRQGSKAKSNRKSEQSERRPRIF